VAKKGKGARKSGNPAKAAQQAREAAQKAAANKPNPFGTPAGEVDYEAAAKQLGADMDLSQFLK
jgi:signal recognition particle subunit SRP54